MNPLFSSEWTREQKEEYATKRMNEMKLKNEKLRQRHAEVEKDRMEAEQKCAAVTISAKALPKRSPEQKSCEEIEDNSSTPPKQRIEREWDVGKRADGDWTPDQQDFSTHPKSHSDGRHFRNEPNYRSNERFNRRGGYLRVNLRQQDSNWSRSSNFHSASFESSGQTSFTSSPSGKDEFKKSFSNRPPHLRHERKIDNDKVCNESGLNEDQNKQSRVENWVKSINTVENWNENNAKTSKSFSTTNKSNFHNAWTDENIEDTRSGIEKRIDLKNKETKCKSIFYKNSSNDKVHETCELPSDQNYQGSFKTDLRDRLNNFQANRMSNDKNISPIERQAELNIHERNRYIKPKFGQKTHGNVNKNCDSELKLGKKEYGYHNKGYSSAWGERGEKDKKNSSVEKRGTWGDVEDEDKKNSCVEKSGTWCDLEDEDKNNSCVKKSGTWGDIESKDKKNSCVEKSGTWCDLEDEVKKSSCVEKSGTWGDLEDKGKKDSCVGKSGTWGDLEDENKKNSCVGKSGTWGDLEEKDESTDDHTKTNSRYKGAAETDKQFNNLKTFPERECNQKSAHRHDYSSARNNQRFKPESAEYFRSKSFHDQYQKKESHEKSGTWSDQELEEEGVKWSNELKDCEADKKMQSVKLSSIDIIHNDSANAGIIEAISESNVA